MITKAVAKLTWDESLPAELHEDWLSYKYST